MKLTISLKEFNDFKRSIEVPNQIGIEFLNRYGIEDPFLSTSTDAAKMEMRIRQMYVNNDTGWTSSNDIAR